MSIMNNQQIIHTFYLYFCSYQRLMIGLLSSSTIMKSLKQIFRNSWLCIFQNLLIDTSFSGWLQTQTIMFLISLAEQQSSFSTMSLIYYFFNVYCISFRFLSSNYYLASASGLPMQTNLENLLFAAESSYFGRFVAPITIKSPLFGLLIPSIRTKNSVFSRREAQCYFSLRAVSIESISSIKMIEGASFQAAKNTFLTIFYDYPRYLFIIEEAESAKNVHLDQLAKALQIKVFPFPGGPQSRSPLGGALIPVQRSGLFLGRITAYYSMLFTSFSPTMSSNVTSMFLMMRSLTSGSIWKSFGFLLGTSFFGGTSILLI